MKIFVATVIAACSLAVHADPLAEFQAIVKQCRQAHEAARPLTEVVRSKRDSSWVKRVYGPAAISYDVRKTDSLVAPFSAYIEVTETLDGDSASTEAEAGAITIDLEARAMRTVSRLRFAYQDSVWQLVDGRTSGSSRSAKGEPFRPDVSVTNSRDDLMKRPAEAPMRSCLGTTS